MAKKPKQFDFATAYASAAVDGGGFKALGDVVGLPDKEDWNNIAQIIDNFRKKSIKTYGVDILIECIADAKREHAAAGFKSASFSDRALGIVNKDAGGRHMFELPNELYMTLTKAYPLMFVNRKHFQWFVKNFSELMIPERY